MPFIKISLSSILSVKAFCKSAKIPLSSTTLRFMASKYSVLSILLQSTHLDRFFFKIISSQIRVVLPFPSRKGCAIFISTYFCTIYSKVSSGIFSIVFNVSSKYKAFANVNPPLLILTFLICPAKSYKPPKI